MFEADPGMAQKGVGERGLATAAGTARAHRVAERADVGRAEIGHFVSCQIGPEQLAELKGEFALDVVPPRHYRANRAWKQLSVLQTAFSQTHLRVPDPRIPRCASCSSPAPAGWPASAAVTSCVCPTTRPPRPSMPGSITVFGLGLALHTAQQGARVFEAHSECANHGLYWH